MSLSGSVVVTKELAQLPALPNTDITPQAAATLEQRIAVAVQQIDSVDDLLEWQRRAEALSVYLKDKEAAPYLWGAQRRIEARVGEVLGPGREAMLRGKKDPSLTTEGLNKDERSDFRQIADLVHRGLLRYDDDAEDSPWRSSRRALLLGEGNGMAVHYASDTPEWYTPPEIIERVVATLGAIDLDPCSNTGTPNVPAKRHFTEADDGLAHPWTGRVYMNPPYGDAIGRWVTKLRDEFTAGRTKAAVALVPARTDTAWFAALRDCTLCLIRGRLRFSASQAGAPFPSVAAYFGTDASRFAQSFSDVGDIWRRV